MLLLFLSRPLLFGQEFLDKVVHISNQVLNISFGLRDLDLLLVESSLRDLLEVSLIHLVFVEIDKLHELELVNLIFHLTEFLRPEVD